MKEMIYLKNTTIKKNIEKSLKEKSAALGFTVAASIGSYVTTMRDSLDLDKVIAYADEERYKEKRKTKCESAK